MKKGNYVYCVKDDVGVYGEVIHTRISKFNNHQEVRSIQTKSGVYSEAVFDKVTPLSESEASKLGYFELEPKKRRRYKKYEFGGKWQRKGDIRRDK